MIHKCPTCYMSYDCNNRNYCFTEALLAYTNKSAPLEDIIESITKINVKCATGDYEIQCVYCAVSDQLGLKWE